MEIQLSIKLDYATNIEWITVHYILDNDNVEKKHIEIKDQELELLISDVIEEILAKPDTHITKSAI